MLDSIAIKDFEVKTPTPQGCKASLTSRELDVAQLDLVIEPAPPEGIWHAQT